MAGGGRGPVERTLPARTGLVGKVANHLGKALTAATQAGPIKYTAAGGADFATVDYLAVNVTAPKNVKEILAPLQQLGATVTHGTTHESLNGWNMVVDVSTTREETMALPQRIDNLAACLRKENIQPAKTVFLALYGGKGVSAKTDLMVVARQVSAAVSQFHVVMVCLPDPNVLSKWDSAKKAAPVAAPVARPVKGGKGSKGGQGGKGAKAAVVNTVMAVSPIGGGRKAGRGGGAGSKSSAVITKQVVGGGRVAGAGRGGGRVAGAGKGAAKPAGKGAKGGKGGKGGKGKAIDIGDGLTKKTGKGGQVVFQKTH